MLKVISLGFTGEFFAVLSKHKTLPHEQFIVVKMDTRHEEFEFEMDFCIHGYHVCEDTCVGE